MFRIALVKKILISAIFLFASLVFSQHQHLLDNYEISSSISTHASCSICDLFSSFENVYYSSSPTLLLSILNKISITTLNLPYVFVDLTAQIFSRAPPALVFSHY